MYQLSVYVGFIRKIVRPGVLWFIRDPNDPNFNPMHEIYNRPFFSQARKIAIGVFLYSALLSIVVGGFVLVTMLYDILPIHQSTVTRIWPLRWEPRGALNTMDFELYVYHYILPVTYTLSPFKFFGDLCKGWFIGASRALRLSNFLIGGQIYTDELSDNEDDNLNTVPGAAKSTRLSYLRVPNHDHIILVPGEKVMVRMSRDDELFGRAGETPAEIITNWRKVIVPSNFTLRIIALISLHWICLIFAMGLVFVTTCEIHFTLVVSGRLFFVYLNDFLAVKFNSPIPLEIFDISKGIRHDLPVHDLFAFLAGIISVYVIAYPVKLLISLISKSKLVRRFSIRRNSIRSRGVGGMVGVGENLPEKFQDRVYLWWQRKGFYSLLISVKALYLSFFFLLLIPLLMGTLFNMYIISPIRSDQVTHIIFIFQDWMRGSVFMKFLFNFLRLFPQNPFGQVLIEFAIDGIPRAKIWTLTKMIIIPCITLCCIALVAPSVFSMIDRRLNLTGGLMEATIKSHGIHFVLMFYGFFQIAKLIIKWARQVRDDQFLVGQRLHNAE